MSDIDVQTEIEIQRSRSFVAEYAADPNNVPHWYVNIQSVEWKTPQPAAVGSRIAFVAHFLGRRLAYTFEILEFVPGERLVMRTSEGPFPMETTYTWSSVSETSTRMTLGNRGRPSGFSMWLTPFMSMMIRRATSKDLRRLKQILESLDA